MPDGKRNVQEPRLGGLTAATTAGSNGYTRYGEVQTICSRTPTKQGLIYAILGLAAAVAGLDVVVSSQRTRIAQVERGLLPYGGRAADSGHIPHHPHSLNPSSQSPEKPNFAWRHHMGV
ncbi:hypothetical protein Dimus_033688 [Dionaea muscipula]